MNKTTLACLLGALLLAGPALVAQASNTAAAPAAAPAPYKQPRAKSKAEANAIRNLQTMVNDPATTPAQMDAAVNDFVTKYPTSDYLSSAEVFGLQFYQNPAHQDYAKSLVFGEQAIKYDPQSLYALATIGDIIPNHVTDTDLDKDQRLQEATQDDQNAIKLVESGTVNGKPVTPEAKNEVEATAYSSLARIATINKDYTQVVEDYAKAIPLDDPTHQAADYFYTARAQIQLKQYDKALASLDAAEKAAPDNPQVKSAVDSNRKLVKQLQAAAAAH